MCPVWVREMRRKRESAEKGCKITIYKLNATKMENQKDLLKKIIASAVMLTLLIYCLQKMTLGCCHSFETPRW